MPPAASHDALSLVVGYIGLMTDTPPTERPLPPLREPLKLSDRFVDVTDPHAARSSCLPATVRTTARLAARGSKRTNSVEFSLQRFLCPRSPTQQRAAIAPGCAPPVHPRHQARPLGSVASGITAFRSARGRAPSRPVAHTHRMQHTLTSGFGVCVQPVSATPLVVYRLAFGSPRSFADVD